MLPDMKVAPSIMSWWDLAFYSSLEPRRSPQASAENMPIKNLESSPLLWDLIEISEFFPSEMGKNYSYSGR